jgi:hypothetical protein
VQVIALLDGHYTAFPGDVLGQAQQAHDCGSDVYLRPSAAQVEFFYTRAGKTEGCAEISRAAYFGEGVPPPFSEGKDRTVISSDHKAAISATVQSGFPEARPEL